MAFYESIFIARQELANTDIDNTINSLKEVLEKNNSKLVDTESWGLRNLAYKIEKNKKGHYIVLKIDGNGSAGKAGAHLVTNNKNPISEGFLTSAWQSPIVGCAIGLGTSNGGLQRMREKIFIYDDKKISTATIVDRCFYDPKGGRMHE